MSKRNTEDDQARENLADPVPGGEEIPTGVPSPEGGVPSVDPVPGGEATANIPPPGRGEENGAGKGADPAGDPENSGGKEKNGNDPGKPGGGEPPGLSTVEEHRESTKTPASVFAAVMQANNWYAGKKVTAEEFKSAVEAFLGAPISGKKTVKKDETAEGDKK
jgi:hypothetical protein